MARTSSPTRPTPEELRNLYDTQGLTDGMIAERCEVSRATVQRWRKEAGIAGRSMEEAYQVRTEKRRTRSDTKRPPKDELIAVLKTMSQRAASRKFGVSGGAVWVWCKYYGIDMAAIKPDPEPTVSAEPPPIADRQPATIDGYRHRLDREGQQTIRRWYERMIAHKRRRERIWAELDEVDGELEYEMEMLSTARR